MMKEDYFFEKQKNSFHLFERRLKQIWRTEIMPGVAGLLISIPHFQNFFRYRAMCCFRLVLFVRKKCPTILVAFAFFHLIELRTVQNGRAPKCKNSDAHQF